jgi:hypothetical protein
MQVAVFVDGENVSADHGPAILAAAQGLGALTVRRVYGNVAAIAGWEKVPAFRLVHSGKGKNATDLLLAVDAMEEALTSAVETVVLASGDGDFVHLATRLRERGHMVVGMGGASAPEPFRAACSRFEVLAGAVRNAVEAKPDSRPRLSALDEKIVGVIVEEGSQTHQKCRSVLLHHLGVRMYQKHKVAAAALPEKTWRAYLGARTTIYDLDPRGPSATVRLRPGAGTGAH